MASIRFRWRFLPQNPFFFVVYLMIGEQSWNKKTLIARIAAKLSLRTFLTVTQQERFRLREAKIRGKCYKGGAEIETTSIR